MRPCRTASRSSRPRGRSPCRARHRARVAARGVACGVSFSALRLALLRRRRRRRHVRRLLCQLEASAARDRKTYVEPRSATQAALVDVHLVDRRSRRSSRSANARQRRARVDARALRARPTVTCRVKGARLALEPEPLAVTSSTAAATAASPPLDVLDARPDHARLARRGKRAQPPQLEPRTAAAAPAPAPAPPPSAVQLAPPPPAQELHRDVQVLELARPLAPRAARAPAPASRRGERRARTSSGKRHGDEAAHGLRSSLARIEVAPGEIQRVVGGGSAHLLAPAREQLGRRARRPRPADREADRAHRLVGGAAAPGPATPVMATATDEPQTRLRPLGHLARASAR